ncbi:MAG: tRNA (adenosine(37)-N6)-threonylcarbamoyltransferase complex ATPase subunit type 1 TsaE [Clostridia bacterium]|nr:tRNA (adenosine(37)-N6)-threonylcarbamoyltransferase complex ATPase subunit type 1 TsaE [Clostridia bacterium]
MGLASRHSYTYAFDTSSREETVLLGKRLGVLLRSGDVVCLEGDLGTGKTVIAEGIGQALQVDDYMTSPTYTIVNEYWVRDGELYHFDLYRLSGEDEVYDMDFDSYFHRGAIILVEWPDRAGNLIPEDSIRVHLSKTSDNSEERHITISTNSPMEFAQ